MVSQSRRAKRSNFLASVNPILWAIAIILVVGVFAVATEAKAESVDAAEVGYSTVGSPSLTAPSIGWELNRTDVVATRISWTPKNSGSYTINVVVGDSFGSATVWATGAQARIDLVSIWPAVDPMFVEGVNLVINEN